MSMENRPSRLRRWGAKVGVGALAAAAVVGLSSGAASAMDQPLGCTIILIVIDGTGEVESVGFFPCGTNQRDGDVWRWDRRTHTNTLEHRSQPPAAMNDANGGQTASSGGSGGSVGGSTASTGGTGGSAGGGCSSSTQNPKKKRPPIAVNQNTVGSCSGGGSMV